MIDPFVLLTPILLLGVIALLRFVGCSFTHGSVAPMEISEISPTSATVCGEGFTLWVAGTGFVGPPDDPAKWSIVQWDGKDRATVFVSSTALTATITADDRTMLGLNVVTVFNPPPGDGLSTNGKAFIITPGPPNVVNLGTLPPGKNSGDPVGVFQNIDFPRWVWYVDGTGQTAIFFDSVDNSRTFRFVNPRILKSMRVYYHNPPPPAPPPPPITITVTDGKNQPASLSITVGEKFKDLNTNWVTCSPTVTITLNTSSDDIAIVELIYLGFP